MTKTQKIWFGVLLGLFVIPEALWSPLGNFYYQFIKGMSVSNVQPFRNNFLQYGDNLQILKSIIFIQTLGVAAATFYLGMSRKTTAAWFLFFVSVILSLFTGFILWYALFAGFDIL